MGGAQLPTLRLSSGGALGYTSGVGIRIIITGGTFDKAYDAIRGELTFTDTHLPEILRRVRCEAPYELEINQLIDSLYMKEQNRQAVLDACRRADERRIVITHGTDTMVETAGVLGRARLPQTVVLTGAMVPYTMADTDAVFNLGSAIAAVQLLPRGVYIVMNGRIFPWDDVRKNRDRGIFEENERFQENERVQENERKE
jgi:L-asparaginase